MSIRKWISKTRIAIEEDDAAIVMKSNGDVTLHWPNNIPEDGVQIDINHPAFKVMLFCWLFQDEQEYILDEFLESIGKEEDES